MKSVVFNNQLLDEHEGHLDGLRAIVSTGDGQWLAVGDLRGQVRIYRDMDEFEGIDIRPRRFKANADRFLTKFEFLSSGTKLMACTGIDVLALDTQTAEVLWRKVRKSSFGFLKVTPHDLATLPGDRTVFSFSDGEMVVLDAEGNEVMKKFENDAPKSMVYSPSTDSIIGTDGYHLTRWDAESLTKIEDLDVVARYYAVSTARNESLFSVRIPNEVHVRRVVGGEIVRRFECRPGLPNMAMDPLGRYVAWIESGAGVIGTVETGEVNRLFEIELSACTVSWNFRDYGFIFGLQSGEMRNVPVD